MAKLTKGFVLLLCLQFATSQFLEPLNFFVSSFFNDDDLQLTTQQRRAVDLLKSRVSDKVSESYMTGDDYLNRFLQAKNYDVGKAEVMIIEDVKWRADNNMSTIHLEDFSDMESKYFASVDSIDKKGFRFIGQPIIMASIGQWNLRKAASSGTLNRLGRYIIRTLEKAARLMRYRQAAGQSGVRRGSFIVNMQNYNVRDQGCVKCIPFYIYLVNSVENHFPGLAEKTILINTPSVFKLVLNVVRPLMSQRSRDTLQIYDHNKSVWQPVLHSIARPDQLPKEYGGTKTSTF